MTELVYRGVRYTKDDLAKEPVGQMPRLRYRGAEYNPRDAWLAARPISRGERRAFIAAFRMTTVVRAGMSSPPCDVRRGSALQHCVETLLHLGSGERFEHLADDPDMAVRVFQSA